VCLTPAVFCNENEMSSQHQRQHLRSRVSNSRRSSWFLTAAAWARIKKSVTETLHRNTNNATVGGRRGDKNICASTLHVPYMFE